MGQSYVPSARPRLVLCADRTDTEPSKNRIIVWNVKPWDIIVSALVMAAPNSWDLALELELDADETSRAVEECDFLRTPSTASHDNSSSTSRPDATKRPSTWWAALLKAAGEPLGFEACSSQMPSIHVVSACTGCAPEAWALKARTSNSSCKTKTKIKATIRILAWLAACRWSA